jgi:ribose-phosphate pyrophosphokinase
VHHFPDGESMVRVPVPLAASTAILYRSLDHPNAKLVELLFAASALRENGASHIILVAPYLAYMRQDKAFNPGEAVSQRVIGTLFADHFDTLFTIDPHLHRIWSLKQIMPNVEAISLTAAPILSAAIEMEQNPVLVGPDSESRQWVETIAGPLGLDVLVGEKQRRGDRDVTITIPGLNRVRGRTAILVDDVISSGATLEVAARLLNHAGAAQVEAIASHCLATEEDLRRLKQAGIARIRSTDAVAGATAQLTTSGILANAVRENQILERAMQRCERQE